MFSGKTVFALLVATTILLQPTASSKLKGGSNPLKHERNFNEVPPSPDANKRVDVRDGAYQILKNALPADRREMSNQLIKKLRKQVTQNKRLHQHPVLAALKEGDLPKDSLLAEMHLDFRAFTKRFTDQITAVALQTKELRSSHGDQVAFAARFLIFLNLLDELGFEAGDREY